MATIHPTALVAPGAQLADDVEIGPYTIIGEHVEIGSGTTVDYVQFFNRPDDGIEMFGGNVYPNDRGSTFRHNRMMWQWSRSGHAARAMLEAIRPYLVCKGDQVDVLLTYRPGRPGVRLTAETRDQREGIITTLARMKKGA